MLRLPNRRVVKRRILLTADSLLTRGEHLWIEVAGGRRRRREGRDVDPSTGRTSLEHLRRGGLADRVWPRVGEALEAGAPPDELAEVITTATARSGDLVAATLRRREPQMLREHAAIRRALYRRMRALWGPAFDAFYAVYVCAEEVGSELEQLHRDDRDPLIEALLALHARACLVLAEVHGLMVRGFPLGAWARTRSLHETAVIASILEVHGREPGLEDLGERFLRHAVIDEAHDLELAARSGIEVDDELLTFVCAERDAVIAQYGTAYAKDYGWARPLFPSFDAHARVTFRRLEALAESGLERLDYRLGSQRRRTHSERKRRSAVSRQPLHVGRHHNHGQQRSPELLHYEHRYAIHAKPLRQSFV